MIDPQTPGTIYGLSSDRKILKSTDGGTNWSPVNSGLPADAGGRYGITSLAIDPQNPTTLYAGNALPGGGVFKTTDGGASWNAVNFGPPDGGVIALAINPQDPGTIYASTWWNRVFPNNSGMLKSTDGGTNWMAVNSGLTTLSVSTLATDTQSPGTVYAGTSDGSVFAMTFAPEPRTRRWTYSIAMESPIPSPR